MQQIQLYSPVTGPSVINYFRARRLLWFTLFILLIGLIVGGTWDILWHVTHVFDGFWSPPHLFVYISCGITGLLVAIMVLSPQLRLAFGHGFRVRGVPFKVPGPLFILVAGLLMVGLAGAVLDNLWHSSFGLDETNWSLPHAMIGWTALIIVLGFVSCRLALRNYKPLRWFTVILLGWLVLQFSASPIMGPLIANRTTETVQAIAGIPVLAAQPPFQHAFRIYDKWNLTRSNPALIILGALWAGAALAFLRKLDRRGWLMLVVVFIWSIMDNSSNRQQSGEKIFPSISDNPANWLNLPLLLPTILLLILLWFRVPEIWAWLGCGVLFGLLVYLTWDSGAATLPLILLAGPVCVVGKYIGERTWNIVEMPYRPRIIMPLILAGFIVPSLTGALDLYLRLVTP